MKLQKYYMVKVKQKAEQTAKQTFETGGVGVGLPEININ